MAGVSNNPNSARQKMINLMYLVFIAMMAMNTSVEVLDSFELVEGSLQKSIADVSRRNSIVADELEAYYKMNREKAQHSYTDGMQTKESADSLFNYIEELKLMIVKESDGKNGTLDDVKRKDHLDAASRVMLDPIKGRGKQLREAVEKFRDQMIGLADPSKKELIGSILDLKIPAKSKLASKNWETALFEKMPVAAAITLLTKLQNDVRNVEGEVLTSLVKSIDVGDYRVNKIEAMVIPESQIVMRGTPYRAQIVLAATDSTKEPRIVVGNSPLDASANGWYTGGSGAIGAQTFSGYIELPQPDGSSKKFDFTETYYVTEQTATIAPVMMNVLYESIDNDIEIAIPGVPSGSVRASISGGTIRQKAGNVWTARPPANAASVKITLTADVAGGRPISMTKDFRVRPLPPAQPFIAYRDASGNLRKFTGGTLSKRSLVEAEGIQAAIDDGILDIPFAVTGFELTFFDSMGNAIPEVSQSNRFTERQKEMIRNLARGKRFYITRIRANDPGGKQQNLSTLEVIVN